jgi:predicted nuclease of predicted toxin-antitoxin system
LPSFRIVLDECVDQRLSREFSDHFVTSVPKMSWAGLKNGELLSNAQHEFDIFLTTDKNLTFQNNVVQYDIAVIVLRAKSNRLQDLQPLIPSVISTLNSIKSGSVIFIPR